MIGRKSLQHDVPLGIDSAKEIFFVTVCALPRGKNHLAREPIGTDLIDTVEHRHLKGDWFAHLFLVMPDHVHGLFSFPACAPTMAETLRNWKRWTARQLGIPWQRGFFDHRLRHSESLSEKAEYILQNPVRARLVAEAGQWDYVWRPKEPHFISIDR